MLPTTMSFVLIPYFPLPHLDYSVLIVRVSKKNIHWYLVLLINNILYLFSLRSCIWVSGNIRATRTFNLLLSPLNKAASKLYKLSISSMESADGRVSDVITWRNYFSAWTNRTHKSKFVKLSRLKCLMSFVSVGSESI